MKNTVLFAVAFLMSLNTYTYAQGNLAGTIVGQVRNADGTPAGGVRVGAAEVGEMLEPASFFAVSRTDPDGRYRLQDVLPGSYLIVAGAVESPTYYPGTIERLSAKPVRVVAGAVTERIDFTVVSPNIGMTNVLSTRSTDRGGRPMIEGRFVVEDGGELPYPLFAGVQYGEHFSATVRGGAFRLQARKVDYVSVNVHGAKPLGNFYIKSMTYGRLDLFNDPIVIAGVADEVVITLARGSRISGVIQTESGVPASVTLYFISEVPITERPDLFRFVSTDEDGRFEMEGVAPGKYVLSSQTDLEANRATISLEVNRDLTDMRLVFGEGRSLRYAP